MSSGLHSIPLRIFVSYGSEDRDFALKLCEDLKKYEINVWIDMEGLRVGDRWNRQLETEINNSSHIIVILSKNSIESHWVFEECQCAINNKKEVIPILLENMEMPFGLKSIHAINIVKNTYDECIEKIVSKLEDAKQQVYNNITWTENIPSHVPREQSENLKVGIKYFRQMINEPVPIEELIAPRGVFQNETMPSLRGAFKSALLSNYLRITGVVRDNEKEEKVSQIYRLKRVIIAKLPQNSEGHYLPSGPIRTELVAFLAASTALKEPKVGNVIGLGQGYTILRLVKNSLPDYSQFNSTKWIALASLLDNELAERGESCNSNVTMMASQQPGSIAKLLPYLSPKERPTPEGYFPDKSELNNDQRVAAEAVREFHKLSSVFISVSGGSPILSDGAIAGGNIRDKSNQTLEGAEILGTIVDKSGNPIDNNNRDVFSISLDLLRKTSQYGYVWIVASGELKAEATRIAINNKIANALVIDTEIADYLINIAETK